MDDVDDVDAAVGDVAYIHCWERTLSLGGWSTNRSIRHTHGDLQTEIEGNIE